MAPSLEAMAQKFSAKSAVLKLDLGSSQEAARYAKEEAKVRSIPTLDFYLNGEKLKTLTGLREKAELEKFFKEFTDEIDDDLTVKVEPDAVETRIEDHMQRVRKDDLPTGVKREKIPKNAPSVGVKGLPKGLIDGGATPSAAPDKAGSPSR